MFDLLRVVQHRKVFFLLVAAAVLACFSTYMYGTHDVLIMHSMEVMPKSHERYIVLQEPSVNPEAYWKAFVEHRLGLQVPIVYDKHFKSPCWHEAFNISNAIRVQKNPYNDMKIIRPYISSKLQKLAKKYMNLVRDNVTTIIRCLPHFHIIGQGKCGTTDLYGRLSLHPQVEMGALKEANWWSHSRDVPYKKLRHPDFVSFNSFVDLFGLAALKAESSRSCRCNYGNENAGDSDCRSIAIGDGSIETLWHPMPASLKLPPVSTIGHFMKWLLPNAKLIVILRNPTSRLYSHFLFADQSGTRNQTHFHYDVVKSIRKYNNCLHLYSEKFCAYSAHVLHAMKVKLHMGLYAVYLEDWLHTYNRQNMFTIRTEDYASSTKETLHELYKFLDICIPSADEEEIILSKAVGNQGKRSIGPMWDTTRKLLHNFYKRYNQQLATLLGDKRFLWNDV